MAMNLEELKERVQADPENAALRMEFGVALAESGRNDEAAVELEKAVALDPANAEAHYNLGVLYGKCLREDLAVDELWEDHSDEEILFENATAHFTAALELDPSLTAALNNLGHLYAIRGSVEEAKNFFRESLKIDPDQDEVMADLNDLG